MCTASTFTKWRRYEDQDKRTDRRRAQWNGAGPTPLIAAMRCYVAYKLGDEIEVPEELQ